MPKLKNFIVQRKNQVGEEYRGTMAVNVTPSGEFTIDVDEVLLTAKDAVSAREYGVNLSQPKKYWKATSNTLANCESYVNALVTAFLSVETAEELVILYCHDIGLAYVRDNNGEIYANGNTYTTQGGAGEFNKDAQWVMSSVSGSAGESTNCLSVGVAAQAFTKTTYARGEHREFKYEKAFNTHHPESSGELLNSFAGLNLMAKVNFHSGRVRELSGEIEEIPYTDEAADFFYNMMLDLCRMADRISSFMGDKEVVMAAIENNTNLLAAPVKELN